MHFVHLPVILVFLKIIQRSELLRWLFKNYAMYIYVYIFIFIASNAQVKQCHVINLVMINYINFYTIIFCAFDRTKCKKYWNVLTITIKHNIFLCNWVLLYHGSPQHNFNEISNASHSITQIIQSICLIFSAEWSIFRRSDK